MIHQTTDIDLFACRVAVYWNLHRHAWSIKTDEAVGAVPRGKVIAWADADEMLALTGCRFHVSVTQHRNALAGIGARGTKRNVVAWVVGKLADGQQVLPDPRRVTFHWPDARSVFHTVDDGQPITRADVAVFTTDRDPDGSPHGRVWIP
jgi:hypothetical protein